MACQRWVPAMDEEHKGYLAFMLRLWRFQANGHPAWRASLENPHTGERRTFADLAALFSFLEERIHELAEEEREGGIQQRGMTNKTP